MRHRAQITIFSSNSEKSARISKYCTSFILKGLRFVTKYGGAPKKREEVS